MTRFRLHSEPPVDLLPQHLQIRLPPIRPWQQQQRSQEQEQEQQQQQQQQRLDRGPCLALVRDRDRGEGASSVLLIVATTSALRRAARADSDEISRCASRERRPKAGLVI